MYNRSIRVLGIYRSRGNLAFKPRHTVKPSAIQSAFEAGKVPNAMTDSRYYNVQLMIRSPQMKSPLLLPPKTSSRIRAILDEIRNLVRSGDFHAQTVGT